MEFGSILAAPPDPENYTMGRLLVRPVGLEKLEGYESSILYGLNISKPKLFHSLEIRPHFRCLQDDIAVTRKQPFNVKFREPFDASFQGASITTGKVRPPEPLFEDHIAGKERLLLRPV